MRHRIKHELLATLKKKQPMNIMNHLYDHTETLILIICVSFMSLLILIQL